MAKGNGSPVTSVCCHVEGRWACIDIKEKNENSRRKYNSVHCTHCTLGDLRARFSEEIKNSHSTCLCTKHVLILEIYTHAKWRENLIKQNSKLRGLGIRNQIVNDLDSKPFEFGRQYQDDSNSNVKFVSLILNWISFQSLFN